MYVGTDDRSSEILLADWGLGDVLVDFDPKREAVFALGETKRGTSIVARYFPGTSERRALVIGGIHGSELAGIEVAERLVRRLEAGTKPGFSVLVVPEVFPDNARIARDATRAGKLRPGADSNLGRITKGFNDPNRQFPLPGTDFVIDPTDHTQKKIETENKILLQLIQEFKPARIASVHAKKMSGRARPGIFADPHSWAATAILPDVVAAEQRTVQDATMALTMARHAAARGARVPGNGLGLTCHKSDCPTWRYAEPPPKTGTSLGEWGPRATPTRPVVTVITIEVQHYYPSDPMPRPTPQAPETAAGVANRVRELEAHCDALLALFLKKP